jgi:hypothetical protein
MSTIPLTGRMRSMWDSIETHPTPLNKLAALVISAGPQLWMNAEVAKQHDLKGEAGLKRDIPITFIDVLDVTQEPPSHRNLKDWRGLRSQRHMVIGFAHLRERIMQKKLAPSAQKWYLDKQWQPPVRAPKKMEIDTTSWFVMRDTGEITIMNCRKFLKKLLDEDAWLNRLGTDPQIMHIPTAAFGIKFFGAKRKHKT